MEREAHLEPVDGSRWWDNLPYKPAVDAISLRKNKDGVWELPPDKGTYTPNRRQAKRVNSRPLFQNL
jgi:hypothetical protein